jgi:hypothetical protein
MREAERAHRIGGHKHCEADRLVFPELIVGCEIDELLLDAGQAALVEPLPL